MAKNYIGEKGDLKKEIANLKKKNKTFMWVAGGLGVVLVGTLIWAFTS